MDMRGAYGISAKGDTSWKLIIGVTLIDVATCFVYLGAFLGDILTFLLAIIEIVGKIYYISFLLDSYRELRNE